jgi:hypothetical protein
MWPDAYSPQSAPSSLAPSHRRWVFRIYVIIVLAAVIVWGVYVGFTSPTNTPPPPTHLISSPKGILSRSSERVPLRRETDRLRKLVIDALKDLQLGNGIAVANARQASPFGVLGRLTRL